MTMDCPGHVELYTQSMQDIIEQLSVFPSPCHVGEQTDCYAHHALGQLYLNTSSPMRLLLAYLIFIVLAHYSEIGDNVGC